MLLVGLTGGIASGKSLVTNVLRAEGARVLDADRIVHGLLEPDTHAWREVVDHFGTGILLPDRRIDRRKLGEIVFCDAAQRVWLNQCLHPRVFDAYQAEVRNLADRKEDSIVVLDAALLIETGYQKNMDRVVVVYADPEQQIERLMRRDQFTREQALARMASQMPLAEKRRYADYIIDNRGTRNDTERQARELYTALKRDTGEKR